MTAHESNPFIIEHGPIIVKTAQIVISWLRNCSLLCSDSLPSVTLSKQTVLMLPQTLMLRGLMQ
ncbi:hypothetical protein DPMN_105936 [Dreissena polymorpha]|uniref:Uncharacterized protein n=1 Tax=Dreissena polymorpha TaxID=45954 RepID=A0A9D4K461_DREPO|nr:hypothetical protein DPMN_105936 [Dreissena polymorpha]